jgi:hypothetical protein
MERRLQIQDFQKVSREDFTALSENPRESFDDLIQRLLIPDKGYSGFTVAESGVAEVTVGPGRMLYNGAMYLNDTEGGTVVSLLASLPTATRRYVALATWGETIETETEPRTFLTDVVTRATEARVVSTELRRWANIATIAGGEGPDPARPVGAENYVIFAYVLLDTAGIVEIEMNELELVPTLREADNRLNETDAWRTQVGTRLDTLASDIAGLASRLFGTARQDFVLDIVRDLARVKEASNLPDEYEAWGSDYFIDTDESDLLHVDYLAEVEEGLHFPPAAIHSAQIALLNQFDANQSTAENFMLPAYDEVARISVVGKDAEQSISQYPFQTVTTVKRHKSRHRHRYGRKYLIVPNTIRLVGKFSGIGPAKVFLFSPVEVHLAWPSDVLYFKPIRKKFVWKDKWEVRWYWENITTTEMVSGAVMAQTFLNSQDGWLTSLDLFFTRVAGSGNVTVLLCECTESGSPNLNAVLGKATLDQEDMRTYPTKTNVPFTPVFCAAGQRLAIVLLTGANHYVALVTGNKFAQGTLFYSTDEAWFQGDLVKDLAFVANFAQFRSPLVVLQLQPLELAGGIAAIDILSQGIIPPQCEVSWQIQHPVQGWLELNDTADSDPDAHPFNGLPPQLPFRAVLVGTTSSMPGIGVGPNSLVKTSRPRSDFKHISTTRDAGTNINTVHLDVRLDNWRGAPFHTFTPRLRLGSPGFATIDNFDTMVEEPAPDDPENAVIRRYTFTGLTPAPTYKIQLEGTTDNVLTPFDVSERVDVALNV